MLTKLKLTAEISNEHYSRTTVEKTFTALELLAFLQQALPGVKPPQGSGTLASPWKPKTPSEWFYCSKMKRDASFTKENPSVRTVFKNNKRYVQVDGTGGKKEFEVVTRLDEFGAREVAEDDAKSLISLGYRFGTDATKKGWLVVGGRSICVHPGNLYSSDCGVQPTVPPTVEPKPVHANASYPNIWGKLKTSCGDASKDEAVTQEVRGLLDGSLPSASNEILPLLTSVLFVSEVGRNHTAFHTNLMVLDLIQARKFKNTNMSMYPGTELTWELALWQDEGHDPATACKRCGGTKLSTKVCVKCRGARTRTPGCGNCGGKGGKLISCPTCKGRKTHSGAVCTRCQGAGSVGNCPTCLGKGKLAPVPCNVCSGTGHPPCAACEGTGQEHFEEKHPFGFTALTGTVKGTGEPALKGGLLAMSHTGSAWGSAFDLTGKGSYVGVWNPKKAPPPAMNPKEFGSLPSTMTIVRRKEATVLIRWLSVALKKLPATALASGFKVRVTSLEVGDGDLTPTADTFQDAYKTADNLVQALSDLEEQRKKEKRLHTVRTLLSLIDDAPKVASNALRTEKKELESALASMDHSAVLGEAILFMVQKRCETFDFMLGP